LFGFLKSGKEETAAKDEEEAENNGKTEGD